MDTPATESPKAMSLPKDLFSLGESNLRLQGAVFQSAHPNEHQQALQEELDEVFRQERANRAAAVTLEELTEGRPHLIRRINFKE